VKCSFLFVDKYVHILCRKCLLKHVIEGKIEGRIDVTGRRERGRKHLLDALIKKERILEIERARSGSHSVENFLS
jgi:hypothetical protein